MNVNIYKMFSPTHSLDSVLPHILNPDRSIFLLFDFVHNLKSIRNNWLNQKDIKYSFTYPDFEDHSIVHTSSFEEVRSLCKADQHSLAKLAPRLTAKSCWPSNLERQNFNLALRIFYDSTVSVLRFQGFSPNRETHTHTAEFLTIICSIWKMCDINTPHKGTRLNDELSNQFIYKDSRFVYLSRVVDWLNKWKSYPGKQGNYLLRPLLVSAILASFYVLLLTI